MNWVKVCKVNDIDQEEVIRFDHGDKTFAIIRGPDSCYYATSGLCTHENIHLSGGLVMDYIIECPKHNGLFDYRTGRAKGPPVCVDLKTYVVKVEGDSVLVQI
jgi:3-phenylpropionate/trans-cinnamate dioxygenase ferredoxin subunit